MTIHSARLAGYAVHPMAGNVRHLDGYNPVDFYDVKTREINRKRIIDVTDLDFLMG